MTSARAVPSAAVAVGLLVLLCTPARAVPQAAFTALVTVVSESGSPAADLTADDFVVREKRAELRVTQAMRVHQAPLFLSILFDISKPPLGTPPPVSDMRAALASFVGKVRAENPGAQIAFTEVAGAAVPTVAFGAPPEDLDKAVSRLFVGQHAEAAMIEGLLDAAKGLEARSAMRKVILLVDFGSHDPTRTATANEALRQIQKATATVWSVSIRPANAPSSRREAPVKAAVESTGGMRLTAVAASGLTSLLGTVADSLASQYAVVFEREGAAPISIDDVRVESKKGQKVLLASLLR